MSPGWLLLGLPAVAFLDSNVARGRGFRSLVIATVAINEVVGPILFKYALERCKATSKQGVTRDPLPSIV